MAFSPFFVFLVTMALSMVPLIESKGAIPVAMSSALWGDAALSAVGAWLATILGGVIVSFVAVIIFLPFRKLLEKISFFRKIFAHCDKAVIEWLAKQQEKKRIRTLNRETKRNIKLSRKKHAVTNKALNTAANLTANTAHINTDISQNAANSATAPNVNNKITFENATYNADTQFTHKRLFPRKHGKVQTQPAQQNTPPQIVFSPKTTTPPAKLTHAKKRNKKAKPRGDKYSWGRFWIAFVFCALPIPLSGVWTAGALCSVLRLDFWRSILALTVANTIDCSLVAVFCFWLEDYIDLMLSIIMIIVLLVIAYQILKYFVSKTQKRALNTAQFDQND